MPSDCDWRTAAMSKLLPLGFRGCTVLGFERFQWHMHMHILMHMVLVPHLTVLPVVAVAGSPHEYMAVAAAVAVAGSLQPT